MIAYNNIIISFKNHNDSIVTGYVHGMAACHETIEWSYKDLKTIWK